jgi:hypothetical protein
MVTPLWSRCPRGFMHWMVFRWLSQGLALICGPDCDSFVAWGPFGVGTRGVCFCLTGRLLLDLCSILEISVVRAKVSEVERL